MIIPPPMGLKVWHVAGCDGPETVEPCQQNSKKAGSAEVSMKYSAVLRLENASDPFQFLSSSFQGRF
jgi:hypothetical protein